MSEGFGCKNCGRSHMGGLSCFYGISKYTREPVTRTNPSKKHSSARKLMKNKFVRLMKNGDGTNANLSFKQYIRNLEKREVINAKQIPARKRAS